MLIRIPSIRASLVGVIKAQEGRQIPKEVLTLQPEFQLQLHPHLEQGES